MTKRMLIDAAHTEESRIVIVEDSKILDYDFVTAGKKQIKGNIYLGKITRVEPSLQAAFVEYGGGRQGFLPFAEIHADYYQIPISDRKRLLEEQEAMFRAEEDAEEEAARQREARYQRRSISRNAPQDDSQELADGMEGGEITTLTEDGTLHDAPAEDIAFNGDSFTDGFGHPDGETSHFQTDDAAFQTDDEALDVIEQGSNDDVFDAHHPAVTEEEEEDLDEPLSQALSFSDITSKFAPTQPMLAEDFSTQSDILPLEGEVMEPGTEEQHSESENGYFQQPQAPQFDENGMPIESAATETAEGEAPEHSGEGQRAHKPKRQFSRRYKIQEVIKRNQIVLVQVIKEERGGKGVSLSTYISLAGRYCVLMPNSPKGGGISRKISSNEDRKRLKQISSELKVSKGMSAIIRTAGIDRTRAEIKRDYDYLVKMWNNIREQTLSSTAPAMIYEESDVVKRAIRDLYNNDTQEILVDGEEAFHTAKEFMKMILPSQVGKVKQYHGGPPIFYEFGMEDQLLSMYDPVVRLRSGAYIVLNPTEALIAIDVNSGRATGERNIEETAVKTNLEAVAEIARQIRLRDLAGLIVIDFIDMMDNRNRRSVEKAMKDALKYDRAKIQLGRISMFGLMEMSRQRLRPSISDANMVPCTHCMGRGTVRSKDSIGIQIIRMLEKEASAGGLTELKVIVNSSVAAYLFNSKREMVTEIEKRYGIRIGITIDDTLLASAFRVERTKRHRDRGERGEAANQNQSSESGAEQESRNGNWRNSERNERDRDRNRDRDRDRDRGRNRGRDRDRNRDRDRDKDRDREHQRMEETATDETQTEALAGEEHFDNRNREQRNEEGGGRRRRGGRRRGRGRDRDRDFDRERENTENGEFAAATEETGEANDNAAPVDGAANETGDGTDRPRRGRGRGNRGGRGRRRWRDRDGEPGAENAEGATHSASMNGENPSSAEQTDYAPAAASSDTGNEAANTERAPRGRGRGRPRGERKPRAQAGDDIPTSGSFGPSESAPAPAASASYESGDSEKAKGPARKGWWRRMVESE